MQQETSEHEIVQKARLVGQLEGRAEAAVEIAELRGEISDLLKRIEEMMVVSRNDQVNEVLVKKMMSILYEALKKEFQTSETTVSRCKNCIRSTTTQLIQQFCPDASERNFRKKKMTRPASQPSIETKSPRESSPERMWTLKKRIGSTKRIVSRERAHETYQIRILNATKVGIGRRAHMVYAINNTLVEPNLVIKRRYREFEWLADTLALAFPYSCVPLLPSKESYRHKSRFENNFVDKRLRFLQIWIHYVTSHSILATSLDLQFFLQASEVEWQQHMDTRSVQPSTYPMPTEPPPQGALAQKQQGHMLTTLRRDIPKFKIQIEHAASCARTVILSHESYAEALVAVDHSIADVAAYEISHTKEENCIWSVLRAPLRDAVTREYSRAQMIHQMWVESLDFHSSKVLHLLSKRSNGISTRKTTAKQNQAIAQVSAEWNESGVLWEYMACETALEFAAKMLEQHEQARKSWENIANVVIRFDTDESVELPTEPVNKVNEAHDLFHPTLDRPTIPEEVRLPPTTSSELDQEEEEQLFHPSLKRPTIPEEIRFPPRPNPNPMETKKWDVYIEKQRNKQRKKQQSATTHRVAAVPRRQHTSKRSALRLHQKVALKKVNAKSERNISFEPDPISPPVEEKEEEEGEESSTTGGWIAVKTQDGRTYYYHKLTRVSRWNKPDSAILETMEERILTQQREMQRRLQTRRRDRQQLMEQKEQEALASVSLGQEVDRIVSTWARNKSIADLLRTIHEIAPTNVTSIELALDCSPSDIKRAYMKIVRLIHPDKLTMHQLRDRLLAQALFTVVTGSYNEFRTSKN